MQPFPPDYSPASDSLSSHSVLVIDDVTTNTELIAHILRDRCVVRTATSGAEGLQLARTYLPSLILLDIWMPDMDGFEVCRHLKADARTQHIPVMFLTGKADVGHEELGLSLGATDFITKPFRAPVLLARVANQLQQIARWQLLEQHARTDSVTGVGNRRLLELQLSREFLRQPPQAQPLSLLLFVITGLTTYQAAHGPGSANAYLLQLARCIQLHLKPPSDLLTRHSEAIFVALLPDTAATDGEQMRQTISAALLQQLTPLPGLDSTSHVFTAIPDSGSSPQLWLDTALEHIGRQAGL